jgi:hypothetical protein
MLLRFALVCLFTCGACGSEDPGGGDAGGAPADGGTDADIARADGGDADMPRLDGGADAWTSPTDADLAGALRIFITSTSHTGALALDPGGLDAPCMAAADAAELEGRWVLWLAIDGAPAQDRIAGDGPFVDMAGTVIFADRAGLASEPLERLVLDENGETVSFQPVWTGTNGDGTAHEDHCAQWTEASADFDGRIGAVGEGSIEWTSRATLSCERAHRLYCFEQRD